MIDNYRKKAIVLFDPANHQSATKDSGFLKNNDDQYFEPVVTTYNL